MNKETKLHGSGSNFTDRIRFSLALKLNLRMLGMLLSVFLSLNLLLSLLLVGSTLWKAESGAGRLLAAYGLSEPVFTDAAAAATGYQIRAVEDGEEGLLLPPFFQSLLPLNRAGVRRRLVIPGTGTNQRLDERVLAATYHLTLREGDAWYRISYALGPELRLSLLILLIFLGFELLYFFGRIRTNTRVIRRTLQPLTEMAEAARSIQQEMSALRASGAGIKRLAGVISTIDPKQLNRQLSVETTQEELKDLAAAINDLLYRIRQAYQSQVRFVADASHELRTPISVLQGYANLLDRWGKHDEQTMQEAIDAIKSETENMKILVEQLLFLARGDNETIHLERTAFDCCKVVEEIVRDARLIDPVHTYETRLAGPAWIEADQQLIKQALRVLVDNSIKYTPGGGMIRLQVFKEEETVKIQVQDNGIGIPPEDVPRIFDRFYRSDQSRARKTGGSGLGLAIARWIVEHHAGHFEVISRLEIGTRISIILPAAQKPPVMAEDASEEL